MKLLLPALALSLFCATCSCTAFGKTSKADEKKSDVVTKKEVPRSALDRMDFAQFKMQQIGQRIVKKHEEEANKEIKEEFEPWQEEIRAFEKKYGVKLFDDSWNRCCDDYDAATGEVSKGTYKSPAPQSGQGQRR